MSDAPKKPKKKVSKRDAIRELWNRGELKYKLKGKQHELYDDFKNATDIVNVIASSRRLGKSHILCILAIEECIKTPGAIVKYASATKTQVDEILSVVLKPILEDVPAHLKPEWKEAKGKYVFPNGSQIQIAATEKGHIERLRGGQANIAIVDEAAFATGLDYVVQNILIPAVSTTKGKIILCSTPNYEDPQHTFNVDYLAPREAAGTLKKFTIYDCPMLDEDTIAATIEAYGGVDNPRFRAEFLCEIISDPEKMVFSELTPEKESVIVREVDMPHFYDAYVSMDIGFKDLTGVLFGYYDYLNHSIVILDELIINGPELTTDYLAEKIKEKEALHFKNINTGRVHITRVADNNNPILLNDLYRLHGLSFIATAKDNKHAQVNEVKLRLKQDTIIIHPRCENLLYQMRSLKWNKHRKAFERIRANKEKGYPASHGDLCFLEGSTVITSKGIKNIEDIIAGDFVLTHKGNFKKVNELLKLPYSGKCLDIGITGRENIRCTPDHKFLACETYKNTKGSSTGQLATREFKWVPAADLKITNTKNKGHRVVAPLINNEQPYALSKEMCFLYGYYVAEGSLSGNKSTIAFAGHVKEKNVLQFIEDAVLNTYGDTVGTSKESKKRHLLGTHKPKHRKAYFYANKNDNSRTINISCRELYGELRELGTSVNKKFPDFLHKLDREQSLFMLAGYLFGDGHLSKDGIKSNSISKHITYGVEQLALQLGVSGSVRFHDKSKWDCRGQYVWDLPKPESNMLKEQMFAYDAIKFIFEDKKNHEIICKYKTKLASNYKRISKIEEFDFEGHVYTLNVEDDHSYTVNGISVKNCDSEIYLVRNVLTTKNPYPDNYFALNGPDVFSSDGSSKVSKAIKEFMNGIVGKKSKK